MSKGTAKSSSPEGKRVTLGSWALNAERRNLKSPVATRQSVIARRAAFWSCFWWLPTATVPPPEAWRPPATFQACRRLINTSGWQLTTTSTSGTATANARFLSKAPDEKPVTSASGTIAERAFCTRAAKVLTARSLLGVADNCKTSSSTCAAQDWAFNSGPATGFTVCVRTKPREVAEEFPGDDEGFAAAAAAKAAGEAAGTGTLPPPFPPARVAKAGEGVFEVLTPAGEAGFEDALLRCFDVDAAGTATGCISAYAAAPTKSMTNWVMSKGAIAQKTAARKMVAVRFCCAVPFPLRTPRMSAKRPPVGDVVAIAMVVSATRIVMGDGSL
mmetsp:Transcript_3883/g.8874  ORF Transcript_3883/g.8874 Transcript_3883/m.8874 type:complete len:330 (+) Transcript_3883:1094-2083(+)